MRPARIVALVVGSLVALAGLLVLLSGGALGLAYLAQRDSGYLSADLADLESPTAAVTLERLDIDVDPGTPRWVIDALDTDIRIRASNLDGSPVFVGVAPEADLDRYLQAVAHDEVVEIDNRSVELQRRAGRAEPARPTDQDFWSMSTTGAGTQELVWEASAGQWALAVMNADGSPGLATEIDAGFRTDAFLPATLTLLAIGAVLLAVATVLVLLGGLGLRGTEPPAPVPVDAAGTTLTLPRTLPRPTYPLRLEASLDPNLSRWLWLVKWFLAIPHLIVLFLLWTVFVMLTILAGISILFTGRYPRSIFDFNVGVLRWGWRVSYYGFSGGLGTDRYPPFTLARVADYPAALDVTYPERLSRGLVLVKWWLLAIPHYVVVAIIAGAGIRWSTEDGVTTEIGWSGAGLVGLLTLVAAIILLATGAYPEGLFRLIIGMNRWVYRVVAYAALMTDRYPPFRLDQGGSEQAPRPMPPPGPLPVHDDEPIDLTNHRPPDTEQVAPGHGWSPYA